MPCVSARATRLKGELRGIQGFWSRKAKEKGVLTEKDLKRFLDKMLPREKT